MTNIVNEISVGTYNPDKNEIDNIIDKLIKSNMLVSDILDFKTKLVSYLTTNNDTDKKELNDIKESLEDIKDLVDNISNKKKTKKLLLSIRDDITKYILNCNAILLESLINNIFNDPEKLPEEAKAEFLEKMAKYANNIICDDPSQPVIES